MRRWSPSSHEAVTAGVRVELCLRGNCSLPHLVYQAIAKALHQCDHLIATSSTPASTVLGGGGEPKYYIGSTDWMTRNLDRRIEVMTPVYDPAIQRELDLHHLSRG